MSGQNPAFIPGPTNIPDRLHHAMNMQTMDHRQEPWDQSGPCHPWFLSRGFIISVTGFFRIFENAILLRGDAFRTFSSGLRERLKAASRSGSRRISAVPRSQITHPSPSSPPPPIRFAPMRKPCARWSTISPPRPQPSNAAGRKARTPRRSGRADRSPCGTGSNSDMAVRHVEGQASPGVKSPIPLHRRVGAFFVAHAPAS